MLDLNLDIEAILSNQGEDMKKVNEPKDRHEDSGTSNSSVINADETQASNAGDENSSNTTSAFIFDIIKKDKIEPDLCQPPSDSVVTRQLFPSVGDSQWLNLSNGVAAGGFEEELRAVHQKQQQVRKSRRGPRSRSSQYRGVTFYRRTSRWESHIWSVFVIWVWFGFVLIEFCPVLLVLIIWFCVCRDCGKQVYLGEFWFLVLFTGLEFWDFVFDLLGGFDTAHAAARYIFLTSLALGFGLVYVLTIFFGFLLIELMIELRLSSVELRLIWISIWVTMRKIWNM